MAFRHAHGAFDVPELQSTNAMLAGCVRASSLDQLRHYDFSMLDRPGAVTRARERNLGSKLVVFRVALCR